MLSKKKLFLLTIFALTCLCIGFVAGFLSYTPLVTWNAEKYYRNRRGKFSDKPAPTLATRTVDNNSWSLQDYRGKIVLVNFWAVWCAPCLQEIPELKEIYSKYKNHPDFFMVGVSLDQQKEVTTQFCKQRQIEWLQLYEDDQGWNNSLARAFDIQFIPSIWLIDRGGNIIAFETSLNDIEAKLAQTLNQQ